MEKVCSSIGVYDKCNNLVSYVEFKDEDQKIKCYYSVAGNVLNRKYVNEYESEPSEMVSSIIQYSDNIMLYPINVHGETAMRTIQSGVSFTSFSSPAISSRIDVYTSNELESPEVQCFSVKSDLIDEWLNKV
jgi:hypothetical protein